MQKLKWDMEDERRLQELEQRRKLFNEVNLPILVKAIRTAIGKNAISDQALSSMAFNMTKNADAIRDALSPYDSGIRVQKHD
jgi:hypothetical protein